MSMFSPWSCCMVFILPFFLDSFLDMSLRRNNIIFSPLVQFFFLLVTEKLVRKLMGERKMVFFPISIFFPMDHAVFGSPSQTVTLLRCMKMIFTLGLNVHSSACKFNDFVMNNPDNCSFNHFFFSSILLPIALLSLGFIQVNTLLTTLLCFLEKPTI